jgi:dynein light chain LC8-type
MNNNLEEAFDKDNDEEEVRKYGIKQKQKKKTYKVVVIILIIVLFVTCVYLFYLYGVLKHENKSLKSELRKANIEKNSFKMNLMNAEKQLKELDEKYNNIQEKNSELTIDKTNDIIALNKKINDLEMNNKNLELKNNNLLEKNVLLDNDNKKLLNELEITKVKFKELNDNFIKHVNFIKEIQNNYPSLQRNDNEGKIIISQSDMVNEELKQAAINIAIRATELNNDVGGMAYFIKNEFDTKYEPAWECIVGYDYGASITHEKESYISFFMGKYKVLLFKVSK